MPQYTLRWKRTLELRSENERMDIVTFIFSLQVSNPVSVMPLIHDWTHDLPSQRNHLAIPRQVTSHLVVGGIVLWCESNLCKSLLLIRPSKPDKIVIMFITRDTCGSGRPTVTLNSIRRPNRKRSNRSIYNGSETITLC